MFARKEIITGNTWSLWRTLKEGSEWKTSDALPSAPSMVGYLVHTGRQGCFSWDGWCWLLPRTHSSDAEPSVVVFSCHGKERRLLAGQDAAGEVVWAVWPSVAGLTRWCQPGITDDPWNQECFLPRGCFSCQSSTAQPGVLAEVSCEVREGVSCSASERGFSTCKVNPAFPSFFSAFRVQYSCSCFSCAAAVSKKGLSYPAQQKRIDKSFLDLPLWEFSFYYTRSQAIFHICLSSNFIAEMTAAGIVQHN